MKYNDNICYRGYTITKRKSICDDIDFYYSIHLNGKFITVSNTIQIAKLIIDEREELNNVL